MAAAAFVGRNRSSGRKGEDGGEDVKEDLVEEHFGIGLEFQSKNFE